LRKASQSILEYALLIAVVIAALLIMQTFMKRGYQGRLKDSSDRMAGGESYSASSSTTLEDRQMTTDKNIHEETATNRAQLNGVINNFGNPSDLSGLNDKAYAGSTVVGGETKSVTLTKMSGATSEAYQTQEYTAGGLPPLNPMSSDANDVFR
jgi:hypothetical protein